MPNRVRDVATYTSDGVPLNGARIVRKNKVLITTVIMEDDQDPLTNTFKFLARKKDDINGPKLLDISSKSVTGNEIKLTAVFDLLPADTADFNTPPVEAPLHLEYQIDRLGGTNDTTTIERGTFWVIPNIE